MERSLYYYRRVQAHGPMGDAPGGAADADLGQPKVGGSDRDTRGDFRDVCAGDVRRATQVVAYRRFAVQGILANHAAGGQ